MSLLERDSYLDELRECLDQAGGGTGQLVFLGGEAGIGKTSLTEAFLADVGDDTRVAVISCDGLKMPGAFGALHDIAEAVGPEVEALIAAQAPRDEIFRAVLAALRTSPGPVVLVGEDAHWSDEATLELIRYLGRRIDTTRTVFIVNYRDDTLGPYHPLRRVLGDLANAPAVRRIDLPRLSLESVTRLAEGSGIDPVALYERTGGNPFYVTEILGAGTMDVPPTVRDAVLARAANLSPEARTLLDAAAAIGVIVSPVLLEAVIGGSIEDAVEECLAAGMFRPSPRNIVFRHGLARDTFLVTMSAPRRRALHRRILAAMEDDPALAKDLAHLAHHAEEAGDAEAVQRYAVAAAQHAAAFRSHREAAAQYERALRFAERFSPEERASLLEARSYECYLTGDLDEAISERKAAIDVLRLLGDRRREGDNLRWLARFCWFAGRNHEAERYANDAYALLVELPPGPELAMACSTLTMLRMLAGDTDAAVEFGERAIAIATDLGEERILAHALANVGTTRLLREEESGREMLERSLAIAKRGGFDDDAARALANLAWESWRRHQLARAEAYVDEGIDFATERDLVAMEMYLRATRGLVWLAQGNLAGGLAEAEAVARVPAATLPTRIIALACVGRARALRGDDPAEALAEARALAYQTGELQRIGHVQAARAEAAWLAGDLDRTADEAGAVFDQAIAGADRWVAGELGLWLHRAGKPVATDGLAKPFALEIAGDATGAAAMWSDLGYPLEAARARASSGTEADLRAALDVFDALDARADAGRVARLLREMGVRNIPRGPRPATRSNAGSLTARELEVLQRLATGESNREIAERLFLSPKTVGHHVSSILNKLDVATRQDAVRHAQELGLLQNRESSQPM